MDSILADFETAEFHDFSEEYPGEISTGSGNSSSKIPGIPSNYETLSRPERVKILKRLSTTDPFTRKPKCLICKTSVVAIFDHIENKHLQIEGAYKCDYCNQVFKSGNQKSVHIYRNHNEQHKISKAMAAASSLNFMKQ